MSEEKIFNEEILNSLAEGVITVDKSFKINFINKAAENITGHTKENVIGQYCKHVLKCDLCQVKCPIGIVLETGNDLYDYSSSIETASGILRRVKINAAILKNSESIPVGGVISFRDLSELEKIKSEFAAHTNFLGIIGHSKAMQEIFSLIKEISESSTSVLIQGESGTGKEMIANAVQATSLRRDKPFLKVNCSVFPQNLLASELFGHIKGAFTDAIKDRPGRFEIANTGTIFLDEVAEMPLQTQIQLLRVLQEGTFERVGESITRTTDVRVISATNMNIEKALQEGKMRQDLFYRLSVIPIIMPPLRERKEDIPYLVNHFIKEYREYYKKDIDGIKDEALDILLNYNWPGNVRELENVIEYAVVRSQNKSDISDSSLPSTIKNNTAPSNKISEVIFNKGFRSISSSDLIKLLDENNWNKTKVAKELGIGRTTLWRMLKDIPQK